MNDRKLQNILLECLAANWGIEGKLARLPGENLNFLVTTGRDEKYVLKIVDEDMPPAVVEMEFAAIEHAVAAGFQLHLPRIMENRYGKIESGIDIHRKTPYRAKLIEFIRGIGMSELADISDNLLLDLGKTIADFNLSMLGFDHPAAHRSHRWNLAEAEQHESKSALIDDRDKQQLLGWAYGAWRKAKGGLDLVPWQFIHGDAHDENILVDGERVSGLIDFGDCCHNPTVCDLAICLTYLMMRGDDGLHNARLITEGYRRIRPLSPAELSMLYPLVCARLAVSVCVANKRKTIDPGNPNWFGGEEACWKLLQRLREMGPEPFVLALG